MHNRSYLLATAAAACLLVACPRPAPAYIKFPPPTLGALSRQSTHIYVLKVEKVEKVEADRGVILFKSAAALKATGVLSDATLAKQVIGANVPGAKVILDWAAEGKTAVLFARVDLDPRAPAPAADQVLNLSQLGVKAHVYIDGYWYWLDYERKGRYWTVLNGEPSMLTRYGGPAEKLGDAVPKILKGEEVVVPAAVSDDPKDLAQRPVKVHDIRASLKILGDEPKLNPDLFKKSEPGTKPNSADKKPGDKPLPLVGTVKALAADGKSFTLLPPPTEKNKEPAAFEIQITERTKITDGKAAAKLAAGQPVSVWLEKGDAKVAATVQIGKPGEKPGAKPSPEDKPGKPAPEKPNEK